MNSVRPAPAGYAFPRLDVENPAMRMSVTLDDDLLAKALAFTGLTETSTFIQEALQPLIERERTPARPSRRDLRPSPRLF